MRKNQSEANDLLPQASLEHLEPSDRQLLLALSTLPALSFSLTAARMATRQAVVRPAVLPGLAEVSVGDERDAPQVRDRAREALLTQLEQLIALGLLEAHEDRYRIPAGLRESLHTDSAYPAAVDGFLEGLLDWLELRQADLSALLSEESTWRQGLELADRQEDVPTFLYLVGWLAGNGGYLHRKGPAALRSRLLERALERVQGRQDAQAAWILYLLASHRQDHNDLAGAAELLERSILLAEQNNTPAEAGLALGALAAIRAQQGQFDAAIRLLHEKLAALQRAQRPQEFAAACGELAELLVVKGLHSDALELLEQKLGLENAMQNRRAAAMTGVLLGDVYAELGQLDEARRRYAAALPTLEELDPRNAAVARANLGTYLQHAGDIRGAREALLQARAGFERFGMHPQVEELDALLEGLS